mgnify:CR=1 FL=1|jgi:hypothetical protein
MVPLFVSNKLLAILNSTFLTKLLELLNTLIHESLLDFNNTLFSDTILLEVLSCIDGQPSLRCVSMCVKIRSHC